jgi:ankyrin repeat protein
MKDCRCLLLLVAIVMLQTGCATILSSQHDTEDYKPVFADAAAGNLDAIKEAIQKDSSVLTATEWDGATLLHLAVGQNHADLTAFLLSQGADPNALTSDHLTSLHMAAQNGNVTIARLLLEHGARSNPVDSKGWTPLDRAEKWGHPLTSLFLKNNGGTE